MRALIRPPAMLAKVLGSRAVAPADVDDDGWYIAEPGKLYYVRDTEGRSSHVVFLPDGRTQVVNATRAELWATLLDIGASDEEAANLSHPT